mmetsp:Transcript_83466/g.232846  ORF Transcript_83466/g.232846 Transcript_83466/m.232846 type:complete len:213 (-) Transcript_83466:157-795(-)
MKVVLIGDSSVGKTALVYRFTQNQALTVSKATVGIAFVKRTIVDPSTGKEHAVQIWDTAGQEKFQSVTTHHYRAADGALLVYDVTSENSFQNLDRWLNELYENTDPSVQVMLVATKSDLAQYRVVSEERAKAYAQQNNLMYVETSALWDKYSGRRGSAMGVEAIFLNLVQAIARHQADAGYNPSRLDISGCGSFRQKGVQLGNEDAKNDCAC